MQASTPNPRGRWIDFAHAEEFLQMKNMKQMKKLGRTDMAFEHGSKVSAPFPYSKFDFVYFLSNAPANWNASSNYSTYLISWCKMCLHFSDESNRAAPQKEYCDIFIDYTGQDATIENIRQAFEDKLLILASSLEQKLRAQAAVKSKKRSLKQHQRK